MTLRDPKPITLLAATLARLAPADWSGYRAARDAESLQRIAKSAARLAVRQCNEPMDYGAVEKRRRRFEADAAAILQPYGVDAASVSASGDPRGAVLSWQFPECNGRRLSNGLSGDWGL